MEKERARELFWEGYNCSQSVFTAFAHRFGIDEETAKKISAGLGGGVGRQREVCGAVSAASMVLGSVVSAKDGGDSEGKEKNYELVTEFCGRFKEKNGTIICRELLENSHVISGGTTPDARTAEYYKDRPCLKLVEDAAEILMDMLKDNE